LILSVCLLGATAGAAQVAFPSVNVVIVDSSGSPVPGVTVTVSDPVTGLQQTAVTGPTGQISVLGLAPGTYHVEASLAGFATAEQTVSLSPGQARRVEIVLGGPVPEGIGGDGGSGGDDNSAVGGTGGMATPTSSTASQVEVLERNALDDVDLDTLLVKEQRSGWALDALIPRGLKHSVLVFRRTARAAACEVRGVPAAFSISSLDQRLAVRADRRFAGVHLLTNTSYAIVTCEP
jgi:hypothetical protein